MDIAKRVECPDCKKGVDMCHLRPCWGTVEDFRKIIANGYAKKLMIDYYSADSLNNGEKIYFLSGASNGNECSKAHWYPKGTCLLLEDNKCTINALKPTMGRIMCWQEGHISEKLHTRLYENLATPAGRKLLENWKKMVDYVDKDDNEGFNFADALNAMMFGF